MLPKRPRLQMKVCPTKLPIPLIKLPYFDPSVHLTVVQWKNQSGSPIVLQYKNLQILKASALAIQTICPEIIPKKRLKTLSECE